MALFAIFVRDSSGALDLDSQIALQGKLGLLRSNDWICVVGEEGDPQAFYEETISKLPGGLGAGAELYVQEQAAYEFLEFGLGFRQKKPGHPETIKAILSQLEELALTQPSPLFLRLRDALASLWQEVLGEGLLTAATTEVGVALELLQKLYESLSEVRVLLLGEGKETEVWVREFQAAGVTQILRNTNGSQQTDRIDDRNVLLAFDDVPTQLLASIAKQLTAVRRAEPILLLDLRTSEGGLLGESLPDSVFCYGHRDLEAICETNLQANLASAPRVDGIIRKHAVELLDWIQQHVPPQVDGLVGRSPALLQVLNVLPRIAATDITVLLEGESGTGKEVVARTIHRLSKRSRKNFVVVNSGALPENLLESELFGHVRGAFTGAHTDKRGLFEEADGGTLFLDEIGEMSPGLQVKLLRVLQEGEIRRVGSNQVRRVNVRLIAATNRNLAQLVAEKRFREDLFYRLNVMRLRIPPLRERPEDIPLLAYHFLKQANKRMGKHVEGFSPEAMDLLLGYPWPGNVRELENAVEHAVVLSMGHTITPADLPPEVQGVARRSKVASDDEWPTLNELERRHIVRTLEAFDWNLAVVTEKLGISRATLWRKMKQYGLQPPGGREREGEN